MSEFAGLDSSLNMTRQTGNTPNSEAKPPLHSEKRVMESGKTADQKEKGDTLTKNGVTVDIEEILGARKDSEPEMQGLVKEMNRTLTNVTSLRFTIDQKSNNYVVSIVDDDTDEVVREIPSNRMSDLSERMRDFEGLLFDVKA